MCVAEHLGVADIDAPAMREARAQFLKWRDEDPALGVVDDLLALERWTRSVPLRTKDQVLRALISRVVDHDDLEAVTAVCWLMVAGATTMASRLRDLSPDIEQMVASQLWLTVRTMRSVPSRAAGSSILNEVRRSVLADFGLGDRGQRDDRAWAATTVAPHLDGSWFADPSSDVGDADSELELAALFEVAERYGQISDQEQHLITEVARAASVGDAPLRRGQMGFGSAAATSGVALELGVCERTVRRRSIQILERLADFVQDEVILDEVSLGSTRLALKAEVIAMGDRQRPLGDAA